MLWLTLGIFYFEPENLTRPPNPISTPILPLTLIRHRIFFGASLNLIPTLSLTRDLLIASSSEWINIAMMF